MKSSTLTAALYGIVFKKRRAQKLTTPKPDATTAQAGPAGHHSSATPETRAAEPATTDSRRQPTTAQRIQVVVLKTPMIAGLRDLAQDQG
jgi:hypothetical protein